jgi:hypothetical protein
LIFLFVTVDKFLFREGSQIFGLQEVLTFDVGDSGKSPARTALSLILDCGNSTMVSPIVGFGGVSKIWLETEEGLEIESWELNKIVLLKGEVLGGEFISSQVHELGDAIGGGT